VLSSGSETSVVDFSGELNIRNISDVHGRLVEALSSNSSVTVQIADDATVDLTFIQLIESARRTARDGDQVLTMAAPATGPLMETLMRGGFLTDTDAERRNFWLRSSGNQ
jgi:hypothetical protein